MLTEYANKILSHYLNKTSFPDKISYTEPFWSIYVTLYGKSEFKGSLLACQRGNSPEFNEHLKEAIIKCFDDKRFVFCADYILILTIIKEPTVLNPETFTLGKHAVSCENAVYKETVPITSGYDMDHLIYNLYKKANAKEELPLWQHESKSYHQDFGEMEYAHKPVKDILDIDTRMDMAGEFLARMGHDSGMFYYAYDPLSGKFADENNIIRQIATLWIFCKWVNYRNRKEFSNFCNTSLNVSYNAYINNFFQKEVNIAHLGFFLLATLEAQNNKEICGLQDELAQEIISQQNEDGSFRTILGSNDTQKGINYYPCEALLALKEYGIKRKKEISEIDKAYHFYLNHFKNNPNLSIASWFIQAFGKERSQEVLDFMVSKQKEDGSFNKSNEASVCTFTEGLASGERIEETKKALKNCFRLQYQKEDLYYLKGDLAFGGVRESLTNVNLRIDFAQHFLNACMLSKIIL